MPEKILQYTWIAFMFICNSVHAQSLNSSSLEIKTFMFKNAQGFGIESAAGNTGKIIKVTNLNNDGPGSLRAAIESKGPRLVIFEVGGIIDLNKIPLVLKEPYITIAGETAPSPGITIIKQGIQILTHDVLIRHLRFRMGDAGEPKKSGFEPDCSTGGPDAYNIIIDHCSFSWAVDENMSISGPRYNGPEGTSHKVTISNCIIAEGLFNSSHQKGIHSMGTLVHDNCTDIAVIRNYYAHNNQRSPYFKAFASGVIVNNIVYNAGKWGIEVDYQDKEWIDTGIKPEGCKVSVVGNWVQQGMNSVVGQGIVGPRGSVYIEDNIGFGYDGRVLSPTYGETVILTTKPSWPEILEVLPSSNVVEHVLSNAGARPKERDEVDKRLVADFYNKTGHFINSQDDVGGYPKYKEVFRKLNVPDSNIMDWLSKFSEAVE